MHNICFNNYNRRGGDNRFAASGLKVGFVRGLSGYETLIDSSSKTREAKERNVLFLHVRAYIYRAATVYSDDVGGK